MDNQHTHHDSSTDRINTTFDPTTDDFDLDDFDAYASTIRAFAVQSSLSTSDYVHLCAHLDSIRATLEAAE